MLPNWPDVQDYECDDAEYARRISWMGPAYLGALKQELIKIRTEAPGVYKDIFQDKMDRDALSHLAEIQDMFERLEGE
jgi:hypothetical protein